MIYLVPQNSFHQKISTSSKIHTQSSLPQNDHYYSQKNRLSHIRQTSNTYGIIIQFKATSKNCFATDLWNFLRKISRKKNVNVAIKRVKSNALALSSDSNINEVNCAKVSKNILLLFRNVEFLEVALGSNCFLVPLFRKTCVLQDYLYA